MLCMLLGLYQFNICILLTCGGWTCTHFVVACYLIAVVVANVNICCQSFLWMKYSTLLRLLFDPQQLNICTASSAIVWHLNLCRSFNLCGWDNCLWLVGNGECCRCCYQSCLLIKCICMMDIHCLLICAFNYGDIGGSFFFLYAYMCVQLWWNICSTCVVIRQRKWFSKGPFSHFVLLMFEQCRTFFQMQK
jgi:hypothetical protein